MYMYLLVGTAGSSDKGAISARSRSFTLIVCGGGGILEEEGGFGDSPCPG